MSRDFSLGVPTPYKGQIYGSPIKYTTVPNDVRVVRVDLDWSDYGVSSLISRAAVSLNLLAAAVQTPLDAIRSVYIDNTFSNVSVYVQFPDTKFTIVCPPNYVVMSPAYTNVQEAVIYAEGFRSGDIPTTKLHFSSANAAGYAIPSTGRQPLLLFPQSLRLDATPSANFSFANTSIGQPQDNRLIACIAFGFRAAGAGAVNVTAASIGSINATVLNVVTQPIAPSASAAIFYAIVPNGVLAPIGINWAAVMDGCYLQTYTIYNQTKNAPYFISGNQSAGIGQLNMDMDMPEGSASIFGALQNGLSAMTWTNVDDGDTLAGASNTMSTASLISTVSGVKRVSIDPANLSVGAVFI